MGFQETKIPDAIKLTDYLNKPLVAYFLGSRTVNTNFGDQQIHEFQKEDGTKINIWGFTALNRLLEHTPKGLLVKATYTGKATVANKYGNKPHTCTVFFDEDKKLQGIATESDIQVEGNDDLPF
jgi:hypothetical protein